MFWKKKKKPVKNKIILGMIMLKDEKSFVLEKFLADYKSNYEDMLDEPVGNDDSAVITIDGEMLAIGSVAVPIPINDIRDIAPYAYNWEKVLEDTKDHKGHLIVTVLKGSDDPIKRFMIFTRVICSLLRTTNAIGVFKGNQSLLIPANDYLEQASFMSEGDLPVNLWVYFGLRTGDEGNSVYTFGLKEFGKHELEIVNSEKTPEEILNFLFDIAHYVICYNIHFKDGETCGVAEDERVPISLSKGKWVEGDTFKLAY